MKIEQIDISSLERAFAKFKVFCLDLSTEKDQAAAIQAFEYTYELSWKTMRKVLIQKGLMEINSPRDVFRAAGVNNLIDDVELWFNFLKLRNLTVHTYNQDSAEQIVQEFPVFKDQVDKLLNNLNQEKK